MQQPTRVILVRHGRSTFNEQGRYQGSSNEAVLSPEGIKTSRLVGKYLRQIAPTKPIDVIYASPLRRVQQTAYEIVKAMASVNRPPIVVSDELKEISLSLWEGLTYVQVKRQFASQYQCWQQRPDEFELPVNSEMSVGKGAAVATAICSPATYFPVKELYRDARCFWNKVLPRHAGSTLLIVSHSGTIHALLSTALGLSPAYHHSLQQSNCGISELTFTERGVQLHQLNQTTALDETLPKLKVNKQGLRLLLLANDGLSNHHCERLAGHMKTIPLDFCLSVDKGQAWLRSLMQHSPNVLCLGAQKADFLQDWQQHLGQSRRFDEGLMTGLAIAPIASIQKLLIQTLGGDPEGYEHIAVRHGQLSIIHYPYNHRPVVQAINTSND